MLCAANLTDTVRAERNSFGNVLITGHVIAQKHPKVFSSVFMCEFSSRKGDKRSDQSSMHLPASKHHKFRFAQVQQ